MSFIERRDLNRPTSGEAPFVLGETFFSRTDTRGVIQAGNDTFRRVSGYSWEELLGAPHKTIRHPDMPKGFFQHFWNTVQSGRPIAGYVQNLSKDGLNYWVLAVVVPIDDGFLSVRIKPSSGMLATIETVYSELRCREQNEGLSAAESASLLLEKLAEIGFPKYSDFETHILAEEISSSDALLENPIDTTVAGFKEVVLAVASLKASTDKLVTFFEEANAIPTNLRLLASRLEPAGGPLTSLSENYWKMADDMAVWFTGFVSNSGSAFDTIQGSINDAMLLRCATRVLTEAAAQFSTERRNLGGLDAESECSRISGLAVSYERESRESLHRTELSSKDITNAISVLRRHILGLSTTRVMCKIESAGLAEGGENLSGIIAHFENFQSTVEGILDEIEDANTAIISNSKMIQVRK